MASAKPFPFGDTQVLSAFTSQRRVDDYTLERAAHWLQSGWPVVVPSETVYGLAAAATNTRAVERVFEAKGRPSDNPLIVHISSLSQAAQLGAKVSELARQLAAQYWPGPLTLVVECSGQLPWVTAGLNSIALRLPNHAFFQALIEAVGPLAAPSANRSGYPSPTRAEHARHDLQGRVPLVVDGGPVEHGLESTVVDARGKRPCLLRPGSVVDERWQSRNPACPPLEQKGKCAPRSPGLKYRHYSPLAEVWLYPHSQTAGANQTLLLDDARWLSSRGRKVAIIGSVPGGKQLTVAHPQSPDQLAYHLFDWLRGFDGQGVDCILVQGIATSGIGHAIMDRLTRAAHCIRLTEQDIESLPLPQRRAVTEDTLFTPEPQS